MVSTSVPQPQPETASAAVPASRMALVVVTSLFFMWGFLTCLNDILIPHLKATFSLNYAQSMLIQFTFFGAYFLMSLPAGKLVSRVGYKHSIIVGLAIAGLGALLFWPAAQLRVYELFLGALFVLATGITILQVAANPYMTLLGPERTASSRLNLAQAFNSLGTAIAPLFGGMLILTGAVLGAEQLAALSAPEQLAYQTQQAQSVQVPYIGLALALFALAVVVWLFRLPAIATDGGTATSLGVLRHSHVRLGVIAIFAYVGAEVAIGSFLVNYLSQPEIGAMTEQHATRYVSAYWTGAMVGRFIGAALLLRIDPGKLLAVFAGIVVVLLGITMTSDGMTAVYSIVAIGLFNSIMFPTIFTLGVAKLGVQTDNASSLLVMAIVGGALVPLAQGFLADRIGIQPAFVLPLLCYLYIMYYGLRGSRVRDVPAVR
ncbi:MAG: L-fucose:H+ symporter permease [Luteimonas sp.]|nr:L-fucose:H+ symporter permease [Luteimonas sp.]